MSKRKTINDLKVEKMRFQYCLPIFRKCLSWTIEDMAKKIAVTKPTISYFDKVEGDGFKRPITYIQYFALRSMIENEISKKQFPLLAKAYSDLMDVDDNDEIWTGKYINWLQAADTFSPLKSGTTKKAKKVSDVLLGGIIGSSTGAAAAASATTTAGALAGLSATAVLSPMIAPVAIGGLIVGGAMTFLIKDKEKIEKIDYKKVLKDASSWKTDFFDIIAESNDLSNE